MGNYPKTTRLTQTWFSKILGSGKEIKKVAGKDDQKIRRSGKDVWTSPKNDLDQMKDGK